MKFVLAQLVHVLWRDPPLMVTNIPFTCIPTSAVFIDLFATSFPAAR